jgi:hypothetical protein
MRRFGPIQAAVLAAALMIAAALTLKYSATGAPVRALIALIPIPAYIALVVATVRYVTKLDGLQQRICLEAMTFAAVTTGLGALGYGQLEKAGIAPHINVAFVAAALMLLYAVGYFVSLRKYQ